MSTRSSPPRLQNPGGIVGTAVDSRECEERRKRLGLKVLEPEVTRHQQVTNGRSSISNPCLTANFLGFQLSRWRFSTSSCWNRLTPVLHLIPASWTLES
jgi:hypothetical protein